MPHSEKVDVFELTDCQYEPEYLYFTEIDDMLDGRQTFNIIKYNIYGSYSYRKDPYFT